MQFTTLSALAVFAVTHFGVQVWAVEDRSGGYNRSCKNGHLDNEGGVHYLEAECASDGGMEATTKMLLGDCFGNDAAQIVYEAKSAPPSHSSCDISD